MSSIEAKQVSGVMRRINTATFRAVLRGAGKSALQGKRHLVPKTKVDRGDLRRSWRVIRRKGLKRGPVELEAAQLVNDAPHAGIVEGGARPHSVSREGVEAITNWVIRNRGKLGFTTAKGRPRAAQITRRYRSKRSGAALTEREVHPELRSIAWAIVKKIQKRGQKPTWFVRDELMALQNLAGAAVHAEVVRVSKNPPKPKAKKTTGGGS